MLLLSYEFTLSCSILCALVFSPKVRGVALPNPEPGTLHYWAHIGDVARVDFMLQHAESAETHTV